MKFNSQHSSHINKFINLENNKSTSINLPIHKVQSASILQHANLSYSFSKDPRFKKFKTDHQPRTLYQYFLLISLQLPNTLSRRSTGFGIGQKSMSQPNKNLKNPSPGDYNIRRDLINKAKAKSFGIPFYFYRKIFISKDYMDQENSKDNPPVGTYQIRTIPGKDVKKITMKGKLGKKEVQVNDKFYEVQSNLVKIGKFRGIGFGLGQRKFLKEVRRWDIEQKEIEKSK